MTLQVLEHAHNGVGDIHDVKVVCGGQLGEAARGEVQIADLLAQHITFYFRLPQLDMQRAGSGFFQDRADDGPPALVEVIVACDRQLPNVRILLVPVR